MISQDLDRLKEIARRSDLSAIDRELLFIATKLVEECRHASTQLHAYEQRLTQAQVESDANARALCDERLERYKLKSFLREAIREWIRLTPNVDDAVHAWRMAQHANLAQ